MQSVVEWFDDLIDFLLHHIRLLAAGLLLLLFAVRTDVHEELCNLVRVLTRSRNFDWTSPVEVEVTERVGEQLQVRSA